MSRVNPRLVYWIAALYDRKDLSAAHRDILVCLATRKLDFGTGRGYCGVLVLAEDTGWHEHTVRRALEAARKDDPPLLERTSRGHYVSPKLALASEWQVVYPPTVHRSTVGAKPTGQPSTVGSQANRPEGASQPSTGARTTGNEETTVKDQFFNEFFSVYPRPGVRAPALKAWRAAIETESADPAVLINSARRFAELSLGENPQFIPYPKRWLDERRWFDTICDAARTPLPSETKQGD